MDLFLDLCVNWFEYVWFCVCLIWSSTPGLALLIFDCHGRKEVIWTCICQLLKWKFHFKCKFVLRTNIELWWTMKPGFLTDSFPVEFLNQVHNKREKKEIEKKLYVGVLILFKLVYVFSRGLIMLLSCFSSNLQILGPHGSLIYKPKCVWNSKFNYSIQLSLKVSMYYVCIPCTQTWYVFGFHNHHPCGLERILVSLEW